MREFTVNCLGKSAGFDDTFRLSSDSDKLDEMQKFGEADCEEWPGNSHPKNRRQRRDGIPEILQPQVFVVAVLVVVEVHHR